MEDGLDFKLLSLLAEVLRAVRCRRRAAQVTRVAQRCACLPHCAGSSARERPGGVCAPAPGTPAVSTVRRSLARCAAISVLAKVHALLMAMLRGNPTLIMDSWRSGACSRASIFRPTAR